MTEQVTEEENYEAKMIISTKTAFQIAVCHGFVAIPFSSTLLHPILLITPLVLSGAAEAECQ